MDNYKNLPFFKWDRLDPSFMLSCISFINLCAARDIVIEPLVGEVSLKDQARFYKRCKSESAIEKILKLLRDKKCDFLADIIVDAPIDEEGWTTDNLPGYCWHNWGKALKFQVKDYDVIKMTPHLRVVLDSVGLLKSPNYLDKHTGTGYIQLEDHHVSYAHEMLHINDHFKKKFERYNHV